MKYSSLSLLLAFAACGSVPANEDHTRLTNDKDAIAPQENIDLSHEVVVSTTQLPAKRVAVWNALIAVHEEYGFGFAGGDEKTGKISFAANNLAGRIARKPASDYLDCGNSFTGPRADSYRINLRTKHTLEDMPDGGTNLTTTITASARNAAMSSDAIFCMSRGTLEKQIAAAVRARLQ
jgi:hypothetical protein